ncbi:MAG: response regulator transcription factor [bacterium]|nr:response regulator transcription factor [bacterium]
MNANPETIRIAIADDHNLFREMLYSLLSEEDDMDVVGEACNGLEASEICKNLKPDIVILDINMPVMDGLEALREIRKAPQPPKAIILTAIEDDDYIFKLIREGAAAYLLKDTTPKEMIRTIRAVHSGDSVIQPRLMKKILCEFCKLSEQSEAFREQPHKPSPPADIGSLTDREKQVLELVAKGMNNREISSSLFISEATVKTHVANLMSKLDKRDRVELVLYALRSGFSIL